MRLIRENMKAREDGKAAELIGYLPDDIFKGEGKGRLRPAVLVIPGGGYAFVSDREKEPVALKFAGRGICAFTLDYSVAPDAVFPQSLCEALLALAFIREHAEENGIDPANIAICGFSAGGHLAASTACFWNHPIVREAVGDRAKNCRPDKVMLGYPVITSGPKAHEGSFENLLGSRCKDPAVRELVSLEKQVTEDFPPVLIWHTFEDATVPVENSLLFAQALTEHKVPVELHIFPHGSHGLSLGNYLVYPDWKYEDVHESAKWFEHAVDFAFAGSVYSR